MDIGLGREDPRQRPGYYLDGESAMRNAILELVDRTEELRRACDVPIPDPNSTLADAQRKAYREFQGRYFHTTGWLVALHRTKQISDVCYNELLERLAATVRPSLII